MASLKDIAAALGVSESLVSKVLNDRLGTTRARADLVEDIRRKAGELNYRRNPSAEALRCGRQDVLGVFIHASGRKGSGMVERVVAGVSSASLAAEKRLLMCFFHTLTEFLSLRSIAHRDLMDGLVVGGILPRGIGPILQQIQVAGLPVVTIASDNAAPSIPNVGMQQGEIMRLATQHLIDQGCRRIAHIADEADRAAGYRRALRGNGLRFTATRLFAAEQGEEFGATRGEAAIAEFVRRNASFDGLVAQSDEEAVGAINALLRAGRRVPEDVRVIGVDDAPYCTFNCVPVSSISERFDEQGEIAIRMLLQAAGGAAVESVLLQPTLCPRESSR